MSWGVLASILIKLLFIINYKSLLQISFQFFMNQKQYLFNITTFFIYPENILEMKNFEGQNKCQLVRQTCNFVVSRAKYVKIKSQNFPKITPLYGYKKFNQFSHHQVQQQNDQQFSKFIFLIMSCNYCFWPLQGFQYEQLVSNIKKYVTTNVSLQKLCGLTEDELIKQMFNGINVPLASQRARMVREVCNVVKFKFQGSFSNVIKSANKSAVQLLNILTSNFPNFQDHSIYEGHQIHFYKRAQLLIASTYGKYQGKGLGQFLDIAQLTMFADYRVPQILNEYQILEYTLQLTQKIKNHQQLISGCQQQVQIRASVLIATQMLKQYLNEKQNKNCISYEVDQFLWQLGESMLGKIVPHHRTLTMYY